MEEETKNSPQYQLEPADDVGDMLPQKEGPAEGTENQKEDQKVEIPPARKSANQNNGYKLDSYDEQSSALQYEEVKF